MKMRSKILTAIGVVSVAGGLMAVAAPAHAASPGAWHAASICGRGYSPDRSAAAPGGAIVYLSYNGSTDCVVTMKTAHVGTPSFVWAGVIGPNGGYGGNTRGFQDMGNFKYYAGPVYTYAPHSCVHWGGGTVASVKGSFVGYGACG